MCLLYFDPNSPLGVRVQVIKDYQLLGIVCIQVGLDVAVLSVWEAMDPLHIQVRNHTGIVRYRKVATTRALYVIDRLSATKRALHVIDRSQQYGHCTL